MPTTKIKFKLTEKQIESLKPLTDLADQEGRDTNHIGGIIIKLDGYTNLLTAKAYYIPFEDAKYLQAILFVARKGDAISNFMQLKPGETRDAK